MFDTVGDAIHQVAPLRHPPQHRTRRGKIASATSQPLRVLPLKTYPARHAFRHFSLEDELRALTPNESYARALAIAAMLKKDDPDKGNRSRETLSETLPARSCTK